MKTPAIKKAGDKYQYVGLLYILPWIVGFLIFQFYPLISSFIYSFTDYSMMNSPSFIGLKNYTDLLTTDPNFWQSLKVTLIYVVFSVPFKLAIALLIAMILNIKIRAVGFFRTLYYLPSIMGGSVAIAVLWRFLFMKDGFLNKLLSVIHIQGADWLGDTRFSLITISLLTVWQFGSSMVLFLAGLKQIPEELYEAGRMDGASKIRMFFTITIPMLTPIVLFNIVIQMINAFQDFTAAFVITNGGPANSTYLYGIMLYQNAFQYFKMGYASALSWILFVIIIVITALIFKSSSRWAHYEDGGGII
jgi:oligogalacturonide transport system permease protein